MSQTVHAIFDGEVLRPQESVDLEPNTRCLLVIEKVEINGEVTGDSPYPLEVIGKLATDMGVTDFAERHSFYAHGEIEG
jgi:hypothetical protein